MKARNIKELRRAREQVERGAVTPAHVWDVRSDGKGGFMRRAIDPKAFRRAEGGVGQEYIGHTTETRPVTNPVCTALGHQCPHAASLGISQPHAQRRRARSVAGGGAASRSCAGSSSVKAAWFKSEDRHKDDTRT